MVFWANVHEDEAIGGEHVHDRHHCPWLVVSEPRFHNATSVVVVIPLSSKNHDPKRATHEILLRRGEEIIEYECINTDRLKDKDSVALTGQIKTFAHERLLGNPVAMLTPDAMAKVEAGFRYVLAIKNAMTPQK